MSRHQDIYQDLYQKIQNGDLAPGRQLPTERELCRLFSVSRITAMRAINDLERDGLVRRIAGKGSFVLEDTIRKNQMFHLIIPSLARRYYSDMAHAFCSFFYERRATGTVVLSNGYSSETITETLGKLDARNSKGVAIVPSGSPDRRELLRDLLKEVELPVIIGSRELPGFAGWQLIVDEIRAGRNAVDHFADHGHTRIAYAGSVSGYSSSELRYQGFCECCQKHNLRSDYLLQYYDVIASRQIRDLFQSADRPTAVVAADENAALRIQEILSTFELRVPQDVAIVALDGGELAPSLEIPLTCIEFPGGTIGEEMARYLWEIDLGKRRTANKSSVIGYPGTLVVRASCGVNPAKYRHEYLRTRLERQNLL